MGQTTQSRDLSSNTDVNESEISRDSNLYNATPNRAFPPRMQEVSNAHTICASSSNQNNDISASRVDQTLLANTLALCQQALANSNNQKEKPEKYSLRTAMMPVDCVVGDWGEWTINQYTGVSSRRRRVKQGNLNGGQPCPRLFESKESSVDCVVSDWGNWGNANPQTGESTRTRRVLYKAVNGGKDCPDLVERKKVKIDCIVSDWGSWSLPFGFGTKTRSRTIVRAPANGGKPCPALEQEAPATITPNTTAENMIKHFVRGYDSSRDIQIIIDASGSIGESAFRSSLKTLYDLLSYLCPSPEPYKKSGSKYNQLGMMTFSTGVRDQFHFGEKQLLSEIKPTILNTPYEAKTTCTGDAIKHAVQNMKRARNGVKKQVLLLTDGLYNCIKGGKKHDFDAYAAYTEKWAEELKEHAEIFGMMIGIEGQLGQEKLSKLVSAPLRDHLYSARDYHDFTTMVDKIKQLLVTTGMKCTWIN